MSHTGEQTDNHKTENLIPVNQWGSLVATNTSEIEKNLFEIEQKIAPYNIKIVAVTKYFGLDGIINGYNAGLRDFGESRANDAIQKINLLPQEIRNNSDFHFIGHLQTNKVEKVVKYFDYIHSIDSLRLAKSVSKAACNLNKREKVLLQVNNSGETQKFGFTKETLRLEIKEILNLEGLEIVGLMNMAPLEAKENQLRDIFKDLKDFRNELEELFSIRLPELSMGMSNDYNIAIKEGATIIRLGRKLFS